MIVRDAPADEPGQGHDSGIDPRLGPAGNHARILDDVMHGDGASDCAERGSFEPCFRKIVVLAFQAGFISDIHNFWFDELLFISTRVEIYFFMNHNEISGECINFSQFSNEMIIIHE